MLFTPHTYLESLSGTKELHEPAGRINVQDFQVAYRFPFSDDLRPATNVEDGYGVRVPDNSGDRDSR